MVVVVKRIFSVYDKAISRILEHVTGNSLRTARRAFVNVGLCLLQIAITARALIAGHRLQISAVTVGKIAGLF